MYIYIIYVYNIRIYWFRIYWFRKRGYPDYLIKKHTEKTLRLTPNDENNSKKVNGVS